MSAQAIEANVFPPPVGTVRLKKPGSFSAISRQRDKIAARFSLMKEAGAPAVSDSIYVSNRSFNSSIESYCPRRTACSGCINRSVSR